MRFLLQFMSINTHSYTISALFIVFEQCKQRENQAVSDIYWSLLVIIWNCSIRFQSYNHNFPSEFDKLSIYCTQASKQYMFKKKMMRLWIKLTLDSELQLSLLQLLLVGGCTCVDTGVIRLQRADDEGAIWMLSKPAAQPSDRTSVYTDFFVNDSSLWFKMIKYRDPNRQTRAIYTKPALTVSASLG